MRFYPDRLHVKPFPVSFLIYVYPKPWQSAGLFDNTWVVGGWPICIVWVLLGQVLIFFFFRRDSAPICWLALLHTWAICLLKFKSLSINTPSNFISSFCSMSSSPIFIFIALSGHVQLTFFVHFFAVVLDDYNVKLPKMFLWRKCRTCSRSLFFHCRSFSSCIGGR